MYDATIATWESKYFYNRPRPSELDPESALRCRSQQPILSVRACRSGAGRGDCPRVFSAGGSAVVSDHGRTSWLVSCAGRSSIPERLLCGPHSGPKSRRAGHRKSNEGWSRTQSGPAPCRPAHANGSGTNPGNVTAANWNPLLLTSPNQFRPAPPPACDSADVMAETAEVRDFPRTFVTTTKRFIGKVLKVSKPGHIDTRTNGCSKTSSIKIHRAPRVCTP